MYNIDLDRSTIVQVRGHEKSAPIEKLISRLLVTQVRISIQWTHSQIEPIAQDGDLFYVTLTSLSSVTPPLHNVHFVKYVYLPTEQAETYLKSCVLINHSTYICLCLFGWKVNMILKETVTFKL